LDFSVSKEDLFLYMGTNLANDNNKFIGQNSLPSLSGSVNQREADLIHFWHK
ncbi:hypothetical protein MKW98_006596, partial [Papaver atlanticum]